MKQGLLDVEWDERSGEFTYSEPNGHRALLELAPVPSWHELQFALRAPYSVRTVEA